jgi:protein-disulfide isomerase
MKDTNMKTTVVLALLLLVSLLGGCGTPAAPSVVGPPSDMAQVAKAPAVTAAPAVQPTSAALAAAEDDPRALGDANAPLTVVVYSDFECPYCALFASDIVPALYERYVKPGTIQLAYRDFPISSGHPSAELAAAAGRCAAAQGRFWPMHDLLFATHGDRWGGRPQHDAVVMQTFAGELGLDTAAFAGCLDDPQTIQAIHQEYDQGLELRVNATPSFVINGRVVRGLQSLTTFERIIAEASADGPMAASVAAPATPTPLALPAVAPDDTRALGDPNAPITIIVYSDFECPFCAQFIHETFGQLRQHYVETGVVRLVYRDFPIVERHRSALVAAVAARCAAAQGSFWPMHDQLYATHDEEWGGVPKRDRKVMLEFAAQQHLQIDTFEACMGDPTVEQAVLQEAEAARALGVDATPTFLINGRLMAGALPFEAFEEVIAQLQR